MPITFNNTTFKGVATGALATIDPAQLFSSGEQGAWYDPSDLTTMFTTSAGTTAVTAPGAGAAVSVGLILDKSKGLVLGSELVTNGDFSSGTTGWTLPEADVTLTVTDGVATLTQGSVTNFGRAYQAITCEIGKWYEVSVTVTAISNSVSPRVHNGFTGTPASPIWLGGTITSPQTVTGRFLATFTTLYFIMMLPSNDGASASFDNVSVKEIAGNHAYQTDTNKRPVLSARVNLLTQTENVSVSPWTKLGTATTPNATTIELPAVGDYIFQAFTGTVAVGQSFTYSAVLSGTGTVTMRSTIGGAVNNRVTLTSAPTRYTFTVTVAASDPGAFEVFIGRADAGDTATSVTATAIDIRVANDGVGLPEYQRVVDANTYDAAGFPYYLQFDGTDDALVTNSIDFSTGATNPPLGPELVTNGTFATNDLTDWTNTSIGTGTASASTGAVQLIGTDGSNRGRIEQAVSVTAGNVYRVSFDIVRTSGALGTGFTTASGQSPTTTYDTTSGSKVYYLTAPAGAQFFAVTTHVGGGNASIDNISVKEFDANYLPDRMSIFAGVRKLSDAGGDAIIAELSTNASSNAGSFYLGAPVNVSQWFYNFASGGTTRLNANTTNTAYRAPVVDVVTALANISGDSLVLRVDTSLAASNTGDLGTGNYGNYPLYIGSRAGTSLPFNGRLYNLIVLGRGVNDVELPATERYINSKTRAY